MLLTCAQWLTVLFPVSLLAGPAVAEVLSALVSALFLAHSARTQQWQWLRTPWVVLLFAMCGMFVISGLLSADPVTTAYRAFLFIRFPLFAAALAFWAVRDPQVQRRILGSFLLATALLAGDMLLEYVRGYDILGHRRGDLNGFVRLWGPFNKLHPGSTLVWIAYPAIFFLVYAAQTYVKAGLQRAGAFVLALCFTELVIAIIHISGERAAFLSSLLGLVLAMMLAKGQRWFFVAVALVGVAVMVTAIQRNPDVVGMQVTRVQTDVRSFSDTPYGRLWGSAFAIWQDYPLLGTGTKQFRHVCPDVKYGSGGLADPYVRCGLHPHNMYLEVLVETGMISFVLFVSAIGYWAWLAWKNRARVMTDPLLCGLVIACMIRFWPVASMPSHFTPWFASPLWFVVGLTLARLSMQASSHEKEPR